jgi:hypothetical protein
MRFTRENKERIVKAFTAHHDLWHLKPTEVETYARAVCDSERKRVVEAWERCNEA